MVPYKPMVVAVRQNRPMARAMVPFIARPRYSGRFLSRARYAYPRRPMGLNRRGVASQESGFVDLANAAYAADTTGTITLIATVPQGASVNQRVGKKIIWKSLQIKGNVQAGTATTIADAVLLIVYDRRPTGSLPSITDVLVSANSSAFNNDANSGRFRIVRRFSNTLTGNSTTPATGMESVDMDEFVSLKGLQGVFKAAGTGAIGDIEEGALYAITVGSVAAGTTAAVVAVAYRTRFIDV